MQANKDQKFSEGLLPYLLQRVKIFLVINVRDAFQVGIDHFYVDMVRHGALADQGASLKVRILFCFLASGGQNRAISRQM
jgi:hypothetical protein